ncbi:MAG: hypothetical protein ACM3O7_09715 [Acidobacteriota bacterium]
MSGPVWRFEASGRGRCDNCLTDVEGLFVEGQVADNGLRPGRRLCRTCFAQGSQLVVNGEVGRHVPSPAYVR